MQTLGAVHVHNVQLEAIIQVLEVKLRPLASHAQLAAITPIREPQPVLNVQLEAIMQILEVQLLLIVSCARLAATIQMQEALLALNVQLEAIIQTPVVRPPPLA